MQASYLHFQFWHCIATNFEALLSAPTSKYTFTNVGRTCMFRAILTMISFTVWFASTPSPSQPCWFCFNHDMPMVLFTAGRNQYCKPITIVDSVILPPLVPSSPALQQNLPSLRLPVPRQPQECCCVHTVNTRFMNLSLIPQTAKTNLENGSTSQKFSFQAISAPRKWKRHNLTVSRVPQDPWAYCAAVWTKYKNQMLPCFIPL